MVPNGCGFLSSAFARGALALWHSYFKVRHKAKRRLGLQGVDLSAKPFFGLALDSWLALDSGPGQENLGLPLATTDR